MKTRAERLTRLWLALLCLAVATPERAEASNCTINPPMPTSGQWATITYNPAGGPLAAAGAILIHRGINGWAPTASPDQVMTYSSSNGLFTFSYVVPLEGYQVNCCFNDGAGTWDNNSTADWNFGVAPAPAPNPVPAPPALPTNASIANVMMQGFFWDCPSGWYKTLAATAAGLRNMQGGYGIDRIWFPPPSKSQSGGYSMGYDPYDYYDLGQYNQKGTTATHFGTQAELKNAIAAFRTNGIVCMADLVLNHRSGGASEPNPNQGGASTYTDFSGVRSGLCAWHYNQFHPSTFENSDEQSFGGFPDVCHATGGTPGCARYDQVQWAKWLMSTSNAGFDGGWRFDFTMGYSPSIVSNLRSNTSNAFGIGEYWDGNVTNLDSFVAYSGGTCVFDFPAYYTMLSALANNASMGDLVDPARVYAARNPSRAVTFVANHDTDGITTNKMLAYAFILTYQGYPCIFWSDYFTNGLATLGGQAGNGINRLVWVRGALGGGQPAIQLLKTNDASLLVYGTLNGSQTAPGYLVAINNNSASAKSATVTTSNTFLRGKTLQCYAWYSYAGGQNAQPADVPCGAGGLVTVQAPAKGYAVYAPAPCSSPPAPAGLNASGGNAKVVVNWTAVTGADSYSVNRATASAGPYAQIASGLTTPSCTNDALASGVTFFYTVNAVNSCSTSSPSAFTSATTAPAAPSGLSAAAGDAQASLAWTASTGATSYSLKRSTTSGGPFTPAAIVGTTRYTNSSLANGTAYFFVVSAANSGGESADSPQASVRPVSLSPPLLGCEQSGARLQFTWAPDHLGWRLEAQTNPAGAGLTTNWAPFAASETTNLWLVPLSATIPSAFFRLASP